MRPGREFRVPPFDVGRHDVEVIAHHANGVKHEAELVGREPVRVRDEFEDLRTRHKEEATVADATLNVNDVTGEDGSRAGHDSVSASVVEEFP
jgi:hypothetical protein